MSQPKVKENVKVFEKDYEHANDFSENKSMKNVSSTGSGNFEIPDDALVDKIIKQVEHLFSDDNISKDKFLLKHVKRNREGYVSLKLISSLRKIKTLSKDWRVIAYSLKKSKKLQMNDEMTKIKRIDPVPDFDAGDTSRTVLVFHYLPSCWTFENVEQHLKKLGTVKSLQVYQSVLSKAYARETTACIKKTLAFYQKIVSYPFAVVKFETPDEAANAVLQTSHASSIIKIVPLMEDEESDLKCSFTSLNGNKSHVSKVKDSSVSYNNNIALTSVKSYPDLSKSSSSIFSLFNQSPKSVDKIQSPKQCLKDMFQDMSEDQLAVRNTYKGDGPANNPDKRRNSFRNVKQSGVIILRQPKGPDSSDGFKTRKYSSSVLA